MTQHPKAARRPAASLLRGLITVGLIGFGGGSALIPVVEKELVQKRGLLDDHLFTRHTIVANITPPVIAGMLPDVAPSLKPGGVFIGSGILEERLYEVTEPLETMPELETIEVATREGWCGVSCVSRRS